MFYQIDQSIRIENTKQTTYVALTNSKSVIASISANEKRTLKLHFRMINRPLIFKIFTFSVLCAKLICDIKPHAVEIDREYEGHEINIKSFIIQILSIWNYRKTVDISFAEIGKNSNAHAKVYKAYKKRPDVLRIV